MSESNPIVEAQAVLNDLEYELQKYRNLWDQLKKDNPEFEPVSNENWGKKHAQCWLHGATELEESNALEKWLFDSPPLSNTAKENALKHIKAWKDELEQSDAYYAVFDEFELETPHKDEILYDYLCRIAALVEKEGKGARLEWRALKSFLAYMRYLPPEEIAFIEQIFPQKMGIHFGQIIRKIPPEVYPISQEAAGAILFELAQMAIKGRPNSRLSALECLGLSWMCLTASRLRLPTYLERVTKTKALAISIDGEYPIMLVPTHFGERKVRISARVAKFLIALAKTPSKTSRETILQSPPRTLTRTFDRALKNCELNPKLGNITFVTLLSPPHIFGSSYRYQPK